MYFYCMFDFRDLNSLSPHNVKENCKKAFDAGDVLGIPRVIEPTDMDMLVGMVYKQVPKLILGRP